MLPRERVIDVIEHRKPDRVPLYGWLFSQLEYAINDRFGSLGAFEDKYEFDYAHIFGGPNTFEWAALEGLRKTLGRQIEPADLMGLAMNDPNDMAAYEGVASAVRHHKEQRGRFVYVQTPGLFEALNPAFGIENHLMYLGLYPDDIKAVYQRQAEWNRTFAGNCLDLGVDMIHVSDDWGSERCLLFSPATWWELIYPYHKVTADYVRGRGGYLSLHCDGNFEQVLDGVVKLGYQVVHPFQESAGMSLSNFKAHWADKLAVMGGLDVQTTIGFGNYDFLKAEIERVMRLFADGGGLFCSSHFIQSHCSMDELTLAYDTAYDLARRVTR